MVTHTIDKARRLMCLTFTGTVTADDCIAALSALNADPDYDPGFNVLSDSRGIERIFSVEDIERIMSFIQGQKHMATRHKVAVVVSKDIHFGMARMFGGLSYGQVDLDHQVFRNMEEAQKWLES